MVKTTQTLIGNNVRCFKKFLEDLDKLCLDAVRDMSLSVCKTRAIPKWFFQYIVHSLFFQYIVRCTFIVSVFYSMSSWKMRRTLDFCAFAVFMLVQYYAIFKIILCCCMSILSTLKLFVRICLANTQLNHLETCKWSQH